VAVLFTITKGQETFSISSTYNEGAYFNDVAKFTNDLDVVKSTTAGKPPANSQPRPNAQNNGSNPGQPSGQRITISTTNFDDGWVAKAQPSSVQVTKGGVEVRIYPLGSPADNKNVQPEMNAPDYAWSIAVPPAFTTGQVRVREKPQFAPAEQNIWEATVTDKQTGQQSYAALTVVWISGRLYGLLALAPNELTYLKMLPKYESFYNMLNYNKFAASAADLVGTWGDESANSLNYYNSSTGVYAGSSLVATTKKFVFRADGTYHCQLQYFNNGKSGSNEYNGRYTVNGWGAVLNGRKSEGDNGEFWCSLEVVRGGFILHLTHKKEFNGQRYTLYKYSN
jgi:hypothetical protein